MENCININHPDVIKLSSDLGIPNIVTAAKIGVWQDNHNIYDRFPSKEELFTNSVIDIDSNIITQDNNSYYRGQLQPFTIDNDGNLILEPKYAGWQEEISHDIHKGMGISLSPDLSIAQFHGEMYYKDNINRPLDERWLDEQETEDWVTNAIEEGYYIVQIDKQYIQDNFKYIFDNNQYEQRIGTDKAILIPKGKYKIKNVRPDTEEEYKLENTEESPNIPFEEIENVSNMIVNKLLVLGNNFRKRDFTKAKYNIFYKSDNAIKYDIAKEIIENIFDSFTANKLDSNNIETSLSDLLDNDLKSYFIEKLEKLKSNYSDESQTLVLDTLQSNYRLIENFLKRNNLSEINMYDENQQITIRKILHNLFDESKNYNFKSEKQKITFLGNKILQKLKLKIKSQKERNKILRFKLKNLIGKTETIINFLNIIPNYKELIKNKINNQIERVLFYKSKVINDKSTGIEKNILVRELYNKASQYEKFNRLSEKAKIVGDNNILKYFPELSNNSEIILDLKTVLNKLIDNNSEYKDLAAKLLNFVNSHNNLPIIITDNYKGSSNSSGYYSADIKNVIDKNTNEHLGVILKSPYIEVDINSNSFKAEPDRLLLHEIIHSLTSIYLASVNAEKGENNPYKKLHSYIIQKLKEFDISFSGLLSFVTTPYGLENEHELFSEALTNFEFQELLKQIPPMDEKKYRNLFEQILDFIASIFSIDNYDSVYDQLEEVIYNTMNEQSSLNFTIEELLKDVNKNINDIEIIDNVNDTKIQYSKNEQGINKVESSITIISEHKLYFNPYYKGLVELNNGNIINIVNPYISRDGNEDINEIANLGHDYIILIAPGVNKIIPLTNKETSISKTGLSNEQLGKIKAIYDGQIIESPSNTEESIFNIFARSLRTGKKNKRILLSSKSRETDHQKEKLLKLIEQYPELKFDGILDESKLISNAGIESKVYLDEDGKHVIKRKRMFNYDNITDLLESIIINNILFPQCYYEILGFDTTLKYDPVIILRQPYVKKARVLSQNEIIKYFIDAGFIQISESTFEHKELGIIISDASQYRGNILAVDDDVYPIDLIIDISLKDADRGYIEPIQYNQNNEVLADNGKPSILHKTLSKLIGIIPGINNENDVLRLYEKTKTVKFKQWFRGSKLVDENDEPIVYFHVGKKDLNEFNPNVVGKFTHTFFSRFILKNLRTYDDGQDIYPVFIKGTNIKDVNDFGYFLNHVTDETKYYGTDIEKYLDRNYDVIRDYRTYGDDLFNYLLENNLPIVFTENDLPFKREDNNTTVDHYSEIIESGEIAVPKKYSNNIKSIFNKGEWSDSTDIYAEAISENKPLYREDTTLKERLFDGKDSINSVTVLEKIIKSDHPLSKLASYLYTVPDIKRLKEINIRLIDKNSEEYIKFVNEKLKQYGEDTNWKNFKGWYDSKEEEIVIVANAVFKNGRSESTILHEIIHALTTYKINSYYFQEWNDIYNYVKKELKKYKHLDVDNMYAMSDPHELMTAIFTNSDFINLLMHIPGKQNKSLFQEIINFFKDLFKIKDSTLFDEVMSQALNLINDKKIDDRYLSKEGKINSELRTYFNSLSSYPPEFEDNEQMQKLVNNDVIMSHINGSIDDYKELYDSQEVKPSSIPFINYKYKPLTLKEESNIDTVIDKRVYKSKEFEKLFNLVNKENKNVGYTKYGIVKRIDDNYVIIENKLDKSIDDIKRDILKSKYKDDGRDLNTPWYYYAKEIIDKDIIFKHKDIYFSLGKDAFIYMMENNIEPEYTQKVKEKFAKDIKINTTDFELISDIPNINNTYLKIINKEQVFIPNYKGLYVSKNIPLVFYKNGNQLNINKKGNPVLINNSNVEVDTNGIVKGKDLEILNLDDNKIIVNERLKSEPDYYINNLFKELNISSYLTINEAEDIKFKLQLKLNRDKQSYDIDFIKNLDYVKIKLTMNNDNIINPDINFNPTMINKLLNMNINPYSMPQDYLKSLYELTTEELNNDLTCKI